MNDTSEYTFRDIRRIMQSDGTWEKAKADLKESIRSQIDGAETPEQAYDIAVQIRGVESLFTKLNEY